MALKGGYSACKKNLSSVGVLCYLTNLLVLVHALKQGKKKLISLFICLFVWNGKNCPLLFFADKALSFSRGHRDIVAIFSPVPRFHFLLKNHVIRKLGTRSKVSTNEQQPRSHNNSSAHTICRM